MQTCIYSVLGTPFTHSLLLTHSLLQGVSKTSKVSYENETMRYKVKAPGTATQVSSRGSNTVLTLPPPIRMNDFLQISGEATTAILRKAEEIQFFK